MRNRILTRIGQVTVALIVLGAIIGGLLGTGLAGLLGVRVREAELEYLFASPLAQRVLAENYVGLPL